MRSHHIERFVTILDLPDACFQVIQRQIADLIFQAIKIHVEEQTGRIGTKGSRGGDYQEVVRTLCDNDLRTFV